MGKLKDRTNPTVVSPELQLIDDKTVETLVPYTKAHRWRLEQEGRFPRRVTLGPGKVADVLSAMANDAGV